VDSATVVWMADQEIGPLAHAIECDDGGGIAWQDSRNLLNSPAEGLLRCLSQ